MSGLGAVGDATSDAPSLSETGRYVAFTSRARNLADVGTNDERVYRREIGSGDATILVSRRSAPGNGQTFGDQPSISDDGARVAFAAPHNVQPDPADTNTYDDVYVRDIGASTLTLVSRADGNGDIGNGNSNAPALSGNGDVVAWDTEATNFSDADTEAGRDVYRRSLTAKTTALASVNFDGAKGDNSSTPSIDDGGWLVAFVSAGTTLDPADSSPPRDAYLKDMEFGGLKLLSRRTGDAGTAANAFAPYVALSGDGKHAAIGLGRGITPTPTRTTAASSCATSPRRRRRPCSSPGRPAARRS